MKARKQHGKAGRKPRLSRRAMDGMLKNLFERIRDHRLSLEAMQSETRPGNHPMAEWYARKAFGMMLDHELETLRSTELLAKSVMECNQ